MLSKPLHGWTDFQLDGTSAYSLSYLNDIPFEWLDRAIIGLTYSTSFCVTGYLEPGEFRCMVNRSGCRIEAEGRMEESDTDIMTFCKCLLHDISRDIDAWASFVAGSVRNQEEKEYRAARLRKRLEQLSELLTIS